MHLGITSLFDLQIGQLKISLLSVLDQWSQYKLAAEEINSYLTEGRYSVSRFRLLTGSLEAAQLQVDSLQVCMLSLPFARLIIPTRKPVSTFRLEFRPPRVKKESMAEV